jgi:hypothetical protein
MTGGILRDLDYAATSALATPCEAGGMALNISATLMGIHHAYALSCPAYHKTFYGWRIVIAGGALQFLQCMLLDMAFGVYLAVLVEERGWSNMRRDSGRYLIPDGSPTRATRPL